MTSGSAATSESRRAVSALLDEWNVLDGLLAQLTDEQWSTPTALPAWSVADIAAHIIGTEAMLAGRATPASSAPAHGPHVRNAIGEMNEAWVESLRGSSPADVLAAFRDIVAVRRTTLESSTDDDLAAPAMTPVGPGTVGSFMAIRLFDCWMHELDIRDAVGRPGDESGERADLAFGTFDRAVPFVVGKKAQAPDGARVLVRLTGSVPRTYRVLVDGRAALVPEFPDGDEAVTTTITLDSGLYARLAGGRSAAADHADAITVTGDLDLGHRILDNLATII